MPNNLTLKKMANAPQFRKTIKMYIIVLNKSLSPF